MFWLLRDRAKVERRWWGRGCGGGDLVEAEVDEVQHGGELAEQDALGRGVPLEHVVQLLAHGLDLGAGLERRLVDPVQDALAGPWRLGTAVDSNTSVASVVKHWQQQGFQGFEGSTVIPEEAPSPVDSFDRSSAGEKELEPCLPLPCFSSPFDSHAGGTGQSTKQVRKWQGWKAVVNDARG